MGGEARAQVVLLVRHGEALREADDAARPLSPAGRTHVEKVAGAFAGVAVDEVRHSGRTRARQTAEIFAVRIGVPPDRVREVPGLGPGDDVEPSAAALEADGRSVALVGHLPFMAALASRLLLGRPGSIGVSFGDAACMILSRAGSQWRLEGFLNHHLLR